MNDIDASNSIPYNEKLVIGFDNTVLDITNTLLYINAWAIYAKADRLQGMQSKSFTKQSH